jgi:hypothetical protein
VTVDELRFPIMDQKDWVDALERRELDIALNLDPHDALRVHATPGPGDAPARGGVLAVVSC